MLIPFDWSTFNFTTDPPRLAFIGSILNATETDLSRFRKLGRKLLIYLSRWNLRILTTTGTQIGRARWAHIQRSRNTTATGVLMTLRTSPAPFPRTPIRSSAT